MANFEEFQRISRAYSDASIMMHQAIAHRAGLSATDHKYLGLLMQKEKMTAGEIGEITGLTTGAVTGLIDRLEKMKLVTRASDEADRRKVLIVPNTEKALELLKPLFSDLQKKTHALIETFTDQEVDTIKRYFESATNIMTTVTQNLKNNPSQT